MENIFIIILPLVLGYLLDLALGDPRWLPHPIVLFGNMISFGEKKLNNGTHRFLKGLILTVLLCTVIFLSFFLIISWLNEVNRWAAVAFETIFIFFGLANRSLIQEGEEVISHLEKKGVEAGRKRLSWIVGRDTSQLTPKQIIIAVAETLSENLSDGVVAPLFYYAIGGVPTMMAYKMINTLDSMIGYKNDRYKDFGCFAAKLDDVANYIPARLTAWLMVVVSGSKQAASYIKKYAKSHASPNAGYPESALAGILRCRFGGPNIYHGKLVEKPWIGSEDRELHPGDFRKIKLVNHRVCFLSITLILVITAYWGYYFP